MLKTYRNKMMASVHEMASDFYRDGSLDKKTMREFDVLCLTPVQKMTPEKIRALREREKTSASATVVSMTVARRGRMSEEASHRFHGPGLWSGDLVMSAAATTKGSTISRRPAK